MKQTDNLHFSQFHWGSNLSIEYQIGGLNIFNITVRTNEWRDSSPPSDSDSSDDDDDDLHVAIILQLQHQMQIQASFLMFWLSSESIKLAKAQMELDGVLPVTRATMIVC